MCKYCTGERSVMHLVVTNYLGEEGVFFYIIGNWIYLVKEDGSIDINTRCEITYCPMCRQKVGGIK